MNERTFLQRVAQDEETEMRLMAHVEAELYAFARSEGISADDINDEQITELAKGIVSRGLTESYHSRR